MIAGEDAGFKFEADSQNWLGKSLEKWRNLLLGSRKDYDRHEIAKRSFGLNSLIKRRALARNRENYVLNYIQ